MHIDSESNATQPATGLLSAKQPFTNAGRAYPGSGSPMLAKQLTKSKADISRPYPNADAKLISRIASGDYNAIGLFVDRWMATFFKFTDKLHLNEADGEVVAEEVFRRVMFEAPRFAARPEKFADWLRGTLRDCTAATVLKPAPGGPFDFCAQADLATVSDGALSCSALLRESRVPEALSFLNSLTPYRFTAVYRIEGMSISNVHMFDRLAGHGRDETISPVAQTFCLWIQETLSVVQMSESLLDPRAAGHPLQSVIRSYCGGPIRDDSGDLLGSICHFDYEPQDTTPGTLADLDALGPLLAGLVAADRTIG